MSVDVDALFDMPSDRLIGALDAGLPFDRV